VSDETADIVELAMAYGRRVTDAEIARLLKEAKRLRSTTLAGVATGFYLPAKTDGLKP
jgi:hypothetical protein